jgi:Ca2+-binding EF-hand superfamily protein
MKTNTLFLAVVMSFSSGVVLANEGGSHKGEKFQDLDKDQDGRLSREEAQVSPRMAEKFDKLDTNQDGFVTREEKSAAKAQWKAEKDQQKSE